MASHGLPVSAPPAPAAPRLAFRSVARSHAGRVRRLNEDRLLDRPDEGLWAVADGMGGLSAGDVAAERLIDGLSRIPPSASGYARLADLVRSVETVNAALYAGEAAAHPAARMGCTFVALMVHDAHYACVWAGDSRAYLLRAGGLSRISRDHSVVQELIDAGVVGEADRRRHPSAHLVTRAVGTARSVPLEQRFAPVRPGDQFLLCSDGLTGCLDDAEIAALLTGAAGERAAEALLQAALDRGAPDNVTVVTVAVSAAQP